MVKYPFLACLLTIGLVCCASKEVGRDHADFKIGMSRSDLFSRFGRPDHEQTLYKRAEVIWGPIESFWQQVPQGAKIEIWSYRSTRSTDNSSDGINGSTELYFVNGSRIVNGIGFAVEGAVYEASPRE